MYNDNKTKYNYKGVDIHCPQCGREHGLGLERSCLSADSELDEIWMQCPTCGLKFEGVSVANWRRSEKFKELNKTLEGLCSAFTKQASITEDKTIWTVYFLDSYNHSVIKCFKTRCGHNSIGYLLDKLNKVCKKGDSYIAIVEVE